MILSHIIRKIFRDTFIESIKRLYKPNLKNEYFIRSLPRFIKHSTKINKYSISFPDAESFMSMREEIWNKESYFFETDSPCPYIIDCGSNIGLSVLYFKHLFPNSDITAFEPDPELLNYLSQNLKSNS